MALIPFWKVRGLPGDIAPIATATVFTMVGEEKTP